MADIEISRDGRVQIVRLNRAHKKNALTGEMYSAMAQAVSGADDDDTLGATLFLGQPEVYSAGADLVDFLAVAQGGEKGTQVIDFLRAIIGGTKPLIAGVDGLAVGIGTTMLLHFDAVYATPRAWFQTPFVNLGLVPEAGSSLIAPRIMGQHRAFSLLAMGDRFNAEQAREAGLVNLVVEPEELEENALAAARRIAEKPPEALAIARRLIRGDRDDIVERMEEEGRLFAERLTSDEAKSAFLSFMNKKAS